MNRSRARKEVSTAPIDRMLCEDTSLGNRKNVRAWYDATWDHPYTDLRAYVCIPRTAWHQATIVSSCPHALQRGALESGDR